MPEKKKYPIKTDLFRFVTTRTPDQLTQEAINYRFITHPDISQSLISSFPQPEVGDRGLQDFLQRFEPVSSYKEIRAVNPTLYDAASVFFRNRKLPNTPPDNIDRYRLTPEQLIWMWEQLFYQIITRNSPYVRQAAIEMIIADNIMKHHEEWGSKEFKLLINAKVVVPQILVDFIRLWLYAECAGDLKGVNNLGIADFRKVEQEVCCYVPGEVSHIENILAREYKERSSRNLVRSEQTIEVTNETEIENLTDVTTATRNELSTEIASVINESKSSNYGGSVGVSANYLGAQIDVNAYADFANANSSSFANSTAKTYAEEITKRALERIVQRTTEKRTSTIIKEFEDNNKHGFDNRKGDKHVTGIYRWVDIIYTNRLVNYGKRLMIEFMIPEPAEFYKRVLKYRPEGATGTTIETDGPEPPLTLADFGINNPADIDSEKAFDAAAYFGVAITGLPDNEIELNKSLIPLAPIEHKRSTQSQPLQDIVVPGDYRIYKITGSYTYEYRANSATSSSTAFCNFNFGGSMVNSGGDYSATKKKKTVSINLNFTNSSGNMPVAVSYAGVFGFHGSIKIFCTLKEAVINDWKNEIYNRLLSAYNQKLAQYESDVISNEEFSDTQVDAEATNPAFNRIIEQRELKRACIEMITKPFCRKQGERQYDDINACDKYQIPKIKQNAAFEEYASQVKFFEQAFEWDLISYLFYPYYWADKCDWADLMKEDNIDTVFQAFLQAGMARVIVPVRPQFTQAVTYYMETGDIWLGGDLVPGTENDLYMSIAEELAEIEGTVEEEWETRVPTSLAIVQDKSAKLTEEGLPCCDDVENEDTTTNIKESDEILGNIIPEIGV